MLIAKRYQARRYLPVTCGCIGVPVSKRYRARRHLPVDCRYRREGTGTVPSQYWQTVYGMYDTSPVGAGTGTILACLLGSFLGTFKRSIMYVHIRLRLMRKRSTS